MNSLEDKKDFSIEDLLRIMTRLRAECPWDAKQTHQSLKPYLLEEAYEVLESIDHQDWQELKTELGDLLLQVVFHSEIASENRRFRFSDVVNALSHKLIERHPHVFGDKSVNSAREVQNNWEQSKFVKEERFSLLSGVPSATPALLQAQRLQEKAATVGFEWKSIEPVIEKCHEEWQEFQQAMRERDALQIRAEFGDLLFALVNLARFVNVNAEDALRLTNKKFTERFHYIEAQYDQNPQKMREASLEELDHHWNEAKKEE